MIDSKKNQNLTPTNVAMLILIIALVLRVAYVLTLEINTPIRADAAKYITIAHNLVTHGVYSHSRSENPQPSNFITPGYPLFLASIYYATGNIVKTYNTALIIQAFLGATTVILAYFIALRFLPFWASIAVGVLAAVSPHLIVSTGYLLTETLFAFFLVSSTLALCTALENSSKKQFFVYGILVCCAALIRPVALFLPLIAILPIVLSIDLKINRLQAIVPLALGFILFWAPWAIWSSSIPSPESNAKAVFAYGTYPDFIFKDEKYKGYPYKEDPEFKKMRSDFFYTLKILKQRAQKQPLKYISWYLIGKPTSYWSWSMIQGMGGPYIFPVKKTLYDKIFLANLTYVIMKYLHYFMVAVLFVGSGYYIAHIIRTRSLKALDKAPLVILTILAYATAVHSMLASLPRYSIPFYYFLYLAAAFFLVKFSIYIAKHKTAYAHSLFPGCTKKTE
jgi:4-amino-4-deoxy-L-arabinose transferase-like glycosyltransferase